jgi:hypothetical protein
MPDTASVMPRRSGHLLRHTAEEMPMIRPKITAQIMATTVSHSVGQKRAPIFGDRALAADGTAEVALGGIDEEVHELLRQRLVQAEVGTHQRDRLVVGLGAGRQACRIARQQVHEQETSTATSSSVGIRPNRRLMTKENMMLSE